MNIRKLVHSATFNNLIITVILVNAVLIGLSTYLTDSTALRVIAGIETVCIAIYLVEIALRFKARDSTAAYFRDGWNIFDIVIVIAALIPASNGIGPVLRILRVFRVLRLVKTIPELRLIVTVLLRSVASMKYVALLATILFYVYAVIGVKLLGAMAIRCNPTFPVSMRRVSRSFASSPAMIGHRCVMNSLKLGNRWGRSLPIR